MHKVAWLKGGVILFAGGDKWTVNQRVSLVNLNSSDYSIKIDKVQLADEGVYTCSFHVNQRQYVTQVYITVHGVRIMMHKVAWLKGGVILFAGGDKWTVNQRVSLVNLNSSDYSIKIDKVQLADEGVYTCSFHVNQRQYVTQVYITVHELGHVRLVGGTSHCTGRLEMKHQGEWRSVDGTSEWNQSSSSVVCRQLDCGSAVSTEKSFSSNAQPVWWMRSSCVGSESSLRECAMKKSYSSTATLEVICADLLFRPNITIFTDGFPEGQQVVMGSPFSISCSIQPQYPGGSFHLTYTGSNATHNHTQPAVSHSSTFLFPAADHTHQGNYSCVYHINVFDRSFSSESQFLSLTVSP